MKNQYWPKSPINFIESGVFAMDRLGYLKHKYYFARPYLFCTESYPIALSLLGEGDGEVVPSESKSHSN